MIAVKEQSKSKLDQLTLNNFYVIMDFDRTITTKDSNTTFSLFAISGLYKKEYLEEMNKNYNYYRPLEIDVNITEEEKIKVLKTWQQASNNLMLKYKVKESDITKIIQDEKLLTLREGVIDFIYFLNEKNIPIIVSSAGIGNFIIELLKKYDCYTNNVYVYSNILKFKDNKIIDDFGKLIHSMNKNELELPEEVLKRLNNKKYAVVIGDQLSDINMAKNLPKEDTLSIGFLETNIDETEKLFYDNFDIVLTNNENFYKIKELLIEMRK